MDMKWHPIVNGDLSGIPRDERLLFTGIDHGERYVDFGYIESPLEKNVLIYIGDIAVPVEEKELIAWMELPPPFTPNDCIRCAHYRVWIDGFGDRWSKCELWNEPFAMDECPLR